MEWHRISSICLCFSNHLLKFRSTFLNLFVLLLRKSFASRPSISLVLRESQASSGSIFAVVRNTQPCHLTIALLQSGIDVRMAF